MKALCHILMFAFIVSAFIANEMRIQRDGYRAMWEVCND